jgi:hypothetical protein
VTEQRALRPLLARRDNALSPARGALPTWLDDIAAEDEELELIVEIVLEEGATLAPTDPRLVRLSASINHVMAALQGRVAALGVC